MRRRPLLTMASAAGLAPAFARGQSARRPPVVGYIHPGRQTLGSKTFDALKRDLVEQGRMAGQPVVLEERWAEGQLDRLPALARDLIALGPGVIIAVARPAIDAVRQASQTIPIVATDLENDPVAAGYAENLGRPGRNVTGLFLDAPTMCGKWVQQITELVPRLSRLAVLWDFSTGPYQRDAMLQAARAASLAVDIVEYRGGARIEAALDAGLPPAAQALVMLGSPLVQQAGQALASVTTARRIAAMGPFRSFPANGGLVSYGTDLEAMYRRLVPFVLQVLRGTPVGNLPIEQPSKFELVVNLRTARQLGLAIPPTILASADELIE
jgi:putative ABC transport system substrate-binding protein